MSDQSQGPGWWQASDGKWYPPEQAPGAPQPAPSLPPQGPAQPGPGWWQASDGRWYPPGQGPVLAPAAPAQPGPGWWQASDGRWYPPPQPPGSQPYAPRSARPKKRRGCLTWVMVAVVLLVGIGVVAAVVGSTDEGDPTSSGGAPADPATANPDGAVGASDEVDDVGPCQLVDDRTVLLDITNNSSKQSNYIIDVNFLDAAGQRVADEPFFVNHVRPGERALEESFVFDSGGGSSCEIAEVDRFAGESPDDVAEVQCQVVGEDVLGDIATELVAANGSSKVSDYFISASLMRDGIRIGSADAFIENVRPGESAPGNGLSVTDGPAAGVTCEVVHVERTASE